jgi:hypothetical protein
MRARAGGAVFCAFLVRTSFFKPLAWPLLLLRASRLRARCGIDFDGISP